MTKFCNKCKQELPTTEFYKNSFKPDGLQTICKLCSNGNSKSHYSKNTQKYLDRNKQQLERNTKMVRDAKSVPCADCGQTYPYYVMDFDHQEDKLFNVANRAFRASTKKLLAEMAKCEVVCANCHRIRTHESLW